MTKSHIDAMDHMLNDIFRKVFWEPLEQKKAEEMFCKECSCWHATQCLFFVQIML